MKRKYAKFYAYIGERVRRHRRALEMSQRTLAKKAGTINLDDVCEEARQHTKENYEQKH